MIYLNRHNTSNISSSEVLHMTKYNTLGRNLKRGVVNFCGKLSRGFYKPAQKWITEMVYGLLSGQSCHLTKIARKLKEEIALDKTVERLSRNLMNFEGTDILTENYIQEVKETFDDSTILLIDDSDVSKPCSSKLEGLCRAGYEKWGISKY